MMVVSSATKNYKEIVIIGFTTEMYTSVSVIKSFNFIRFMVSGIHAVEYVGMQLHNEN